VTEAEEKVKQNQANILAAQSRQKSYTDKWHSPLEFKVGDHIYLRVSPMKGVRHFGIKGKLAPCYIGPYPIIDKYGPMSYQVELPAKLSGAHNVFHVSQLKRCLKPPTDVVIKDTIPLEPDLTYKAYPIKVLDQQDRVTRNKTTRIYKIQWNEHSKDEAMWEHEDSLRPTSSTPFHHGNPPPPKLLLSLHFNLGMRFSLMGEGCNTPCYGNPNESY
jgi:hypothetical protein